MIVDDQQSMRIMLRSNLRELGFTDTRDKSSALDALKSIRNDRVHLIISDYNMPDMDGLQFLEEVRKDAVIGKTAFIMLTGSSDRDVVQRAAALGVNNYLVKPFATAALKDKIERIFGALS
jgi:two-component system chemotaxis response regulator CheY